MARSLRVAFPGAYYHITDRGVDRRDVFFDDKDRCVFLKRLAEAHARYGIVIHGYCLMGNHYHLEVETPGGDISRPIQWLNQTYACYVNGRYGRTGPLFQGRFKSVTVEAGSHLHLLTRYIHLNPVRAGIVGRPSEYLWSSYRAYIGTSRRPDWLSVHKTLERFGKTSSAQRRRYRAFVEGKGRIPDPLADRVYGAILGTEGFVEWVRRQLHARPDDHEVSRLVQAKPRPRLETICELTRRAYALPELPHRSRGRKGNPARNVAIYLARERSARPLREIGQFFGGIGVAAISLAHRRVRERMVTECQLREKVLEVLRTLDAQTPPDQ